MRVGMDSKADFQVPYQSEIMGQPNERPNEDELPHELLEVDFRTIIAFIEQVHTSKPRCAFWCV